MNLHAFRMPIPPVQEEWLNLKPNMKDQTPVQRSPFASLVPTTCTDISKVHTHVLQSSKKSCLRLTLYWLTKSEVRLFRS